MALTHFAPRFSFFGKWWDFSRCVDGQSYHRAPLLITRSSSWRHILLQNFHNFHYFRYLHVFTRQIDKQIARWLWQKTQRGAGVLAQPLNLPMRHLVISLNRIKVYPFTIAYTRVHSPGGSRTTSTLPWWNAPLMMLDEHRGCIWMHTTPWRKEKPRRHDEEKSGGRKEDARVEDEKLRSCTDVTRDS